MRTRLTRANRRRALLDVAAGVVAEHGMAETSIALIARRAGVTRPVVYDHFDSGDDVLITLIEAHHASFLQAMGPPDAGDAIGRAAVRALLVGYYEQVAADPKGWLVLCAERSSHPAVAAVQRRTARELDEILAARLALRGPQRHVMLVAGAVRAAVNEIARLGSPGAGPAELADAAMAIVGPLVADAPGPADR